jgi:uncharacterized membrane protein
MSSDSTPSTPDFRPSTSDFKLPTPRLRFIDLLRGVAMLLMIGAHVSDAFLADQYRHNDLWYGVNLLFGFVAPAFLFLSGMTLRIAMSRQGDDRHGRATRRLLRRALVILLLGYWLQIPILSLRQLVICQRPGELARLFDCNILQVIALSMIFVIVTAYAAGSLDRSRLIALAAGLAVAIATPYVWQSGVYLSLPLPLRFYLAPQPPALFSLVPHAAYYLFGFASAGAFVASERSAWGWARMAGVGAVMLAAGLLLDPLLAAHPPFNDFWHSSPQHLLFRTGGIVLGAGIASIADRGIASRHTAWLEYAGRKSLAVYLLHLMIVYGSPMNMGMRYWLHGAMNASLAPAVTLIATLGIIAVTYFAIRAWDGIRHDYPKLALWSKRGWWALFWALFLLEP